MTTLSRLNPNARTRLAGRHGQAQRRHATGQHAGARLRQAWAWHPIGRFACVIALVATGCSTSQRPPLAMNPDTLSDLDFMHEHLADQPLVTVSDAYRAVLILADGADSSRSFAERQARLTERGLVRPTWNLEADDYVDRGSVAFMIAEVAGITGGINRVILGSWGLGDRRYALRELQYRGLIADGTDYAYVSGGELLGILHRADAYLAETGPHDTPPLALPLARDRSTFASPPASQPAGQQ